MKPVIGITMGDMNGVGPEVIIKALSVDRIRNKINPVLFGSKIVFDKIIKKLKSELKIKVIRDLSNLEFKNREIKLMDCVNDFVDLSNIKFGKVDEESGKASVICIKEATKFALSKKINAIVTAPICKDSINKAGYHYPGHTELLAKLTNTKKYAMMFVGKNMRLVLVTTHLALKDVPKNLTKEKIINTILLLSNTLKKYFNIDRPSIGVAALNPHAGESGIFGKEEEDIIKPAMKYIEKKLGLKTEGPIPPDTLFYKNTIKKFDCMVCMYHDQGLIPFKMLNFNNGVNVTIGLPVIRTSPDHGVAFDMAGKGIADPSSMISAIKLARNMVKVNNGS